jgi:hypothetical protein
MNKIVFEGKWKQVSAPRMCNSSVPLLQHEQVSPARGRGTKREYFETQMTLDLRLSYRRRQNEQ